MTDPDLLLRLLVRVHGHLGWLCVAALLHPAILLRRPGRRSATVTTAAAALTTACFGLGLAIYPAYRAQIKPALLQHAPAAAWWFERKEHLAVGALAFAWVAVIAHLRATRKEQGHPTQATDREKASLHPVARDAARISAALAAIAATAGTVISAYRSF